MTTITPLDPTDLDDIRDGCLLALTRLQLANDSPKKPTELLAAVDSYLTNQRLSAAAKHGHDIEELAFELGCLWGAQLVSQLGWQWMRVLFNDQAPEAIAVSSRDNSLVIYPFQTIFLYHERVLPIRVARSFEILSEPGRVPMLPPGGLENVMDHIE